MVGIPVKSVRCALFDNMQERAFFDVWPRDLVESEKKNKPS